MEPQRDIEAPRSQFRLWTLFAVMIVAAVCLSLRDVFFYLATETWWIVWEASALLGFGWGQWRRRSIQGWGGKRRLCMLGALGAMWVGLVAAMVWTRQNWVAPQQWPPWIWDETWFQAVVVLGRVLGVLDVNAPGGLILFGETYPAPFLLDVGVAIGVGLAAYYLGLLINVRGLLSSYLEWKAGRPGQGAPA